VGGLFNVGGKGLEDHKARGWESNYITWIQKKDEKCWGSSLVCGKAVAAALCLSEIPRGRGRLSTKEPREVWTFTSTNKKKGNVAAGIERRCGLCTQVRLGGTWKNDLATAYVGNCGTHPKCSRGGRRPDIACFCNAGEN